MKKFVFCLTLCLVAAAAFAESRNALLIANGNYTNFKSLSNPVPEANNLAKALKELGFTVTVKANCSRREMLKALSEFKTVVEKSGGIAFFHYGGHAVQIKQTNYLIPVDAVDDDDVAESDAIELAKALEYIKGETNIIILDSCRNNPYSGNTRSADTRGMQPLHKTYPNSVIVYSAEAGNTAVDGVFTPILTQKIKEQKPFSRIIKEVRKAVKEQTNGRQNPGYYDDADDDIFLAGRRQQGYPETPTVAQVTTTTTIRTTTTTTTTTTTITTTFAVNVDGKTYRIGDRGPGGGIVFYVSEAGFNVYEDDGITSKKYHCMECSDVISASISWCPMDFNKYNNTYECKYYCCYDNELSTKTDFGYGKYNTSRIITGNHRHGKVTESNCAAYKCSRYYTSSTKAGDWWLPSKDELFYIYDNLKRYEYISDTGWFYSSSSYYNDIAWNQRFSDGNQNKYHYLKNYRLSVRAVRAF